ncbi:MAG: pseudouridine synthase [Clostridia bacterium]|nr:pseudouridine synthase [Clostridia bacterium]
MGKAVRLDKFLADSGAGTRTEVKKLIQKGMVLINGEKAKKPELKVEPEKDVVEYGGQRLGVRAEFVYYLLHKPAGYVSATEDTREKTVLELVPKDSRRNLFPVGRLDKDTEGLLLITDDGQLAHQLLSPKKHVDKTYFAVTEGKVVQEDIGKIQEGVDIGDEEPTLPGKLEILRTWNEDGESAVTQENEETKKWECENSPWRSEILLTIHEGRFHQVKRMMEAVGKKVIYLKRISMGPLTLPDDLPKGEARELTAEEVKSLKNNRM